MKALALDLQTANRSASHEASRVAIRELTAETASRWDEFVVSSKRATFFHRAGWKTVIERAFGHRTFFLYAESQGRIEGVLPLAEVRSRIFGHSLCSLPFCVYGGIAAESEQAQSALDRAAQQLAKELGVDYLEYRNQEASHSNWVHKELYVTFRREIHPNADANLNAIPRKQRAMVRKGMKAGLVSHTGTDVEQFYSLYADNMHRHGTPPLAKGYFHILQQVFPEDCDILLVTDRERRPVSAVFSFYFRDEVLPYYAGDLAEARDLAANDFKYWELMMRALERGCRVFDYGRSKIGTGSYDFKKNWGFAPIPLPYELKLVGCTQIPEVNPLNPKYRLFIALWRRMPLRMTMWLGPHVVKYLG